MAYLFRLLRVQYQVNTHPTIAHNMTTSNPTTPPRTPPTITQSFLVSCFTEELLVTDKLLVGKLCGCSVVEGYWELVIMICGLVEIIAWVEVTLVISHCEAFVGAKSVKYTKGS